MFEIHGLTVNLSAVGQFPREPPLTCRGKSTTYSCLPDAAVVGVSELNAFIYDATVLDYMASHDDNCRLKTVGKWFAATGYGIGFPKGSRWIQVVNRFMVQFQYDGM